MPAVSVVVAVYNIERYVEKCIQSIICQTWKDMEILLIDDGSTDQSGNICDRYAESDARIRVIHKKNGGIADVRNVGLKEASGEYLLYVDGDDYIEAECVEKAMLCARKHDAEVVVFDYYEIEEETGRKEKWSMQIPRDQKFTVKEHPVLLIATLCPWNKLCRKSLWNRAGLQYPVGRVYEDLTITPQLLLNAESIVYLRSEPLYDYILHEGSIMRSWNFQRSLDNRKAALEDLLIYFKEKGVFDTFKKELEYLMFEQVYFVPTKEVIYYDAQSEFRNRFRQCVFGVFPDADKNPYIRQRLSRKDKILLFFMERRQDRVIHLLSDMRKKVDLLRNRK